MSLPLNPLLAQIKTRRKELKLKQNDMMLRVGMSPQQYQRLESKGNPRLDTLELVAKGLKSELILIPQEKLAAVKALLNGEGGGSVNIDADGNTPSIADDPWRDILGDDE